MPPPLPVTARLASSRPLRTEVTLHNGGNRDTRFVWEGELPAFTLREVTFTNTGKPVCGVATDLAVSKSRDTTQPATSDVVRAEASERLAFAAAVEREGVYLLAFRGTVDAAEKERSRELGVTRPTAWTAKKYVLMRAEAKPPAATPAH